MCNFIVQTSTCAWPFTKILFSRTGRDTSGEQLSICLGDLTERGVRLVPPRLEGSWAQIFSGESQMITGFVRSDSWSGRPQIIF